jgi:hypothetical protein
MYVPRAAIAVGGGLHRRALLHRMRGVLGAALSDVPMLDVTSTQRASKRS